MSARNIHKILVIGATGLVGSRFVENYKNEFSIITLGRNGVDVLMDLANEEEICKNIQLSDADAVVNFAAYTNVDNAEKEKGNTEGEVYILNALLPLWLARSCQATGKKLYHISTDYVFDGKNEERPYTEKDIPKPVNSWYSISKYDGELNVAKGFNDEEGFAIVRISYPYSGIYERKLDIARTIVSRLSSRKSYLGIVDQRIKPVSVDDIANSLGLLLKKKVSGIFHVAGSFSPEEYITPFEFAIKISRIFKLDSSLIIPVTFLEFSKERKALRPQHTWLDTQKIENLGMKFTNIDKALSKFKQQFLRPS